MADEFLAYVRFLFIEESVEVSWMDKDCCICLDGLKGGQWVCIFFPCTHIVRHRPCFCRSVEFLPEVLFCLQCRSPFVATSIRLLSFPVDSEVVVDVGFEDPNPASQEEEMEAKFLRDFARMVIDMIFYPPQACAGCGIPFEDGQKTFDVLACGCRYHHHDNGDCFFHVIEALRCVCGVEDIAHGSGIYYDAIDDDGGGLMDGDPVNAHPWDDPVDGGADIFDDIIALDLPSQLLEEPDDDYSLF